MSIHMNARTWFYMEPRIDMPLCFTCFIPKGGSQA